MDADRKKRLAELGPEALAEALLELAVRVDVADDLVERLIENKRGRVFIIHCMSRMKTRPLCFFYKQGLSRKTPIRFSKAKA